jgi:flagellar motor switch protein FliN/FliY
MSAASTPYDWVPEIAPELKEISTLPIIGAAPPFPWDQLAARLAQSFDRELILLKPQELIWRTPDQLYEGLGDDLVPLMFSIPSMKGNAFWIMPQQEMASLEALLLTKESHPITFQDQALAQAFYRFLTLEVLYNISQIDFDKSLMPILMNNASLPQTTALCLDISITIHQQTLWGRLMISEQLQRSWIEYFSQKEVPSPLANQLAQTIEVIMHAEVGKTQLSLEELSHLSLGDWIALDSFSLDPKTLQGNLLLTVDGKSAFGAQLKDHQVQITEFSLFQ